MKKYLKKNGGLIFLFCVILYLMFLFQLLPQTSAIEACLFPLFFLGTSYPFAMYLSRNLLQKALKEKNMKPFFVQFVIFSGIVGIIFLSYIFVFRWFEEAGYLPSTHYFDLSDYPWYFFSIFISGGVLINLCFCGLQFYFAHNFLEKEHLESQLQILKGQINPHFMFNVLNHINYYVERKDDIASPLLLKYADILRYQLYSGKKDEVNLHEEIQFLKDFIDIEKIRWQDNLNISCSWEIEDKNKRIPPLLLIPLVENAFKHVYRGDDNKGYIKINFKQDRKAIFLEVENSRKILLVKDNENSGIGLNNLKNRLDILYGKKYKLSVNETETTYYSSLLVCI